ncbi:MAG: phosphoribosylformylglycinamidine synthase II, partial [Alphaproteobacteria bacterium]
EMALAGRTGLTLAQPADTGPAHAYWFGEDQGRYLAATTDSNAVLAAAEAAGIEATLLGAAGSDALTVDGFDPISIAELRQIHEAWLPDYMAAP